MLLKDLKATLPGRVRTFEGKRVFYMHPSDLFGHLNREDWDKVKDWNGICIYPSKHGQPNTCFYFNWGYGGSPEFLYTINIA